MSRRRRLLAFLLTVTMLLTTAPVQAFAANGSGPEDIAPFGGEGNDQNLDNAFKVMNMKSAINDRPISKYAYANSKNKFYTITNLQKDEEKSEWTYLEYTLELGQPIDLVLYKMADGYPEGNPLELKYNPDDPDAAEDFLGEEIGYLHGIPILDNVQGNADGSATYIPLSEEDRAAIISEVAKGESSREYATMKDWMAYGWKGEALKPAEDQAATTTSEQPQADTPAENTEENEEPPADDAAEPNESTPQVEEEPAPDAPETDTVEDVPSAETDTGSDDAAAGAAENTAFNATVMLQKTANILQDQAATDQYKVSDDTTSGTEEPGPAPENPVAPETPEELEKMPEDKNAEEIEPIDTVRFSNERQLLALEEDGDEDNGNTIQNFFMWNGDIADKKGKLQPRPDYETGRYVIVLKPKSKQSAIYNTFLAFANDVEYSLSDIMVSPLEALEAAMAKIVDPVNLLTGSFSWEYTDFSMFGKNVLPFTRYYESVDADRNHGLGFGWSTNYTYELQAEDLYVRVTFPQGQDIYFSLGYDGNWKSRAGSPFTLEETGSGFVLTHKNGTVYRFDANGHILNQNALDGSTVSYDYDGDKLVSVSNSSGSFTFGYDGDNISSVTDSAGRTITLSYDGDLLTSIINPDGDSLNYTYDGNNCITSITDFNRNLYLENTYDEQGRVVAQTVADQGDFVIEYDDANHTNTCTGENGYLVSITYDELGRIIAHEDNNGTYEYEYNDLNQRVSETDREGNTTSYEHDAAGNITRITYPDGTSRSTSYNAQNLPTEVTERDGGKTTYTYNNAGLPTAVKDARGNTRTYEYDGMGNCVSMTDALGNTTSFAYDAQGNMTEQTDALGNTTSYEFDEQGRLIQTTAADGAVTAYEYSTAGKLVKTTDAAGNVQEYTVNGNGFNTSETDFSGNASETVYNKQNRPLTVTDREGNSTSYEYDAAGNVSVTVDALGGKVSYTYDAQGRMTSMTDARGNTWSHAYDANGQVISETDPLGNTSTTAYDSMGRITVSKNARGAETVYTYDAADRNTTTTDALGHMSRSEYDKNGNLVKSVDKNGNETVYEYDAENRLVKQTDALGQVTTYTYDALGRTTKTVSAGGAENATVYDEVGRAVSTTDPRGNQTQNSYDVLGRLTKTVHADGTEVSYEYDANGLVTKTTDENGNSYIYTYDKNGNVLTTTDPMGGVVTNEYDALGRIIKVVNQAGSETLTAYDAVGNIASTTDALGNVTTYEYDALNRVTAIIDARGGETRIEYDANNNMVKGVQPDGGIVTYEYDLLDQLTKTTDAEGNVTVYEYDANGNHLKATDGRGNTKTNAYDALNRLTSVTNELGKVQSTVYDADGRIVKTINERGAETSYEYDANGNIVKLTDAEGNSTTFSYDNMDRVIAQTNAKGAVTAYAYTPTGQVARMTDADGNVTTYEYDALDRLIKVDAAGLVTTYEYDALGNATNTVSPSGAATTLEYDALGRVIGSTDANGNKTSYVLDANGNVLQTIDALGNVAAFEYDAMDRLTKMTLHRVDGQDNVDEYQMTLYEYDHNGLVTKVVNAAGDAKLMVYDQNGNLLQETDEEGKVTAYSYDARNLVTDINYADGKNVAYTYDEAGNLIQMDDWTGKTTYELDLLDRITAMNDPNGKTVRYAYDATGKQSEVVYPDGTKAAYTYDALDRMTSVTDAEGKVTSYTYNAHGWKTGMTYPNGWSEEYTYDDEGRMLSSIDIDPTNKDAKSPQYTYEYDAAGNLLHEFKRGNGTGAVKEDVTYTYDALNRLTNAHELYGEQNRSYQYDSLGNLTFEQTGNNKTVDYKYNVLNQLTAKIVDGKDNYSYTYDKRGNKLGEVYEKKNKPEQVGAYVYDAANRMVQGTNDLGEQSVYTFNGLGQLVQNTWVIKKNAYGYHDVQPDAVVDGTAVVELETGKKQKKEKKTKEEVAASPELNKTSTVVKDFVIDATSPVQAPLTETEQGESGLTYRYTYGLERVSVQIGNVTTSAGGLVTGDDNVKLYYHTDRLGTYRYLTDDVKGKVTSWTDYDEWGNITHNAVLKMGKRQLDLVKNYTGHEYDNVLAEYYAKARMYDPQDKRFGQIDPIRDGLNWYVYCADNPVIYVDPAGTARFSLVQGMIAHSVISTYVLVKNPLAKINVYLTGCTHTLSRKGFADIILPAESSHEIYEIKPTTYKTGIKGSYADRQLSSYVNAITPTQNAGYYPATRGTSLFKSTTYLPYPMDDSKLIEVSTEYIKFPGMIYYRIDSFDRQKVKVEVVVFTPEQQQSFGYYAQTACEYVDSEYPIDTYQENEYWGDVVDWANATTVELYKDDLLSYYVRVTFPDGKDLLSRWYVGVYDTKVEFPKYSTLDLLEIYDGIAWGWADKASSTWYGSLEKVWDTPQAYPSVPKLPPIPAPVPVPII